MSKRIFSWQARGHRDWCPVFREPSGDCDCREIRMAEEIAELRAELRRLRRVVKNLAEPDGDE